jgi:flagellar protein FliO/FliZ
VDAPLFAAPAASAASTPAAGLAEVTLALLVVVALIAGLAWLMKRMRGFGMHGHDRIQLLADRTLGPKERCVLLRVGDTDILVGIAPGAVNTLHVFASGANTDAPLPPAPTGPKAPNFKDLLMRSLGK